MTTEVTEENFAILFNEQENYVEIQYQGVNAALLLQLQAAISAMQSSLNNALSNVNGSLGTLSNSLNSLTTLVNVQGSGLSAEIAARILADENAGAALLASTGELGDAIETEVETRAAAILAEAAARNAAIAAANATIVTDVAALATSVAGLATAMGSAEASIITVQDALSTEVAARAAQYSAIQADFEDTNAAVLSETVARADGDDALAAQIEVLAATSGSTVFLQDDEPTVGMDAGDIWYDTDDGNKPYRYNGSAWVDVTDVRITNNSAAIATETAARVSGDSANAAAITALSSTVTTIGSDLDTAEIAISTAQAAITSEASTRATADSANASNISTVAANLSTEITNRTNADSSLSAAVSAEASARIAADGSISAKYAIKVDVNGHVSGFGLISEANDGSVVSQFIITADAFKVFNGSSGLSPFSVSGGKVYIDNLVIGGNSSATEGGRIVWSNGSVMKVTGVGFGSTNQFVEWFGPYFADLADCTEANATQYLKTNGDAYFGGALSAGTLNNSGQSSSLASGAEIIVGPFGSNGGEIQVVLSYLYVSARQFSEAGTASGSGGISATIQLYRKIGAGSETLVATLNASGLWTWEKEDGTRYEEQNMGDSLTYTDTAMTTDDRTYRAIISARSLNHTSGGSHQQRVRIQTVEE